MEAILRANFRQRFNGVKRRCLDDVKQRGMRAARSVARKSVSGSVQKARLSCLCTSFVSAISWTAVCPVKSATLLRSVPRIVSAGRGASAQPWQQVRSAASMEQTGSPPKPKIAIAQMCAGTDAEANLAQCRTLVKEAVEQGAALVSLPECFEYMGVPGTGDALRAAQELTGPLMSQYRELAREQGVWLSLGGFHEASADPKKMYNTHVIVNSAGEIVASYRKLHLFDVDYDGGFRESATTIKGEEALLVRDTPVGNIGVTTCYDLRFPELYTALRRAGANVLLVPSAFMPSTGEAHWHVLLRARAIETQCYVAAAAQAGRHNEKRSSFGHALLVDPWGKVLCDLGAEGCGVGVAEIDEELLGGVRRRMPVMEHRRSEVISIEVGDGGHRLRVKPAL